VVIDVWLNLQLLAGYLVCPAYFIARSLNVRMHEETKSVCIAILGTNLACLTT
jgi:hypothetical protein